jgi:hypothetical protein
MKISVTFFWQINFCLTATFLAKNTNNIPFNIKYRVSQTWDIFQQFRVENSYPRRAYRLLTIGLRSLGNGKVRRADSAAADRFLIDFFAKHQAFSLRVRQNPQE